MIFNFPYHKSCRTLFKIKKNTLVSIFISKCVCYVKKHLSMLEVQWKNHNYNTSCTALKIPKFKTSMFKNSPHYYVTLHECNALSRNVKCIDSYYKFKSQVKTLLNSTGNRLTLTSHQSCDNFTMSLSLSFFFVDMP
nr:unnamed protein product [Callosobruchus analis]